MFFRRLNWNVVGWLRTVSIISYAIIARGRRVDGLPLGDDRHAAAAGPLVHRRDRRDREVHAARRSTTRSPKRSAGIGVTDAQVNTLTQAGRAASASATRSRPRKTSATTRRRCGTRSAASRRSTARSRRSRRSARRSRTNTCSTRSRRWSSRSRSSSSTSRSASAGTTSSAW